MSPNQTTEDGTWVSHNAVAWVLDHAPDLPPALGLTLVAVARHAGADGTNAFPSMASLAAMTRKSERQVRRDIGELQKLGLLIPGDPTAGGRLARIAPQYRPHVFDLPLWRHREDVGDTPRGVMDVPPVSNVGGDTGDRSRGDTGVPSEGTSMVARGDIHDPLIRREEPKKKPVEKEETPPLASLASSSPTTRDDPQPKRTPKKPARTKTRQTAANLAQAAQLITDHTDAHPGTRHEADRVLALLRDRYNVGNPLAYIQAAAADNPDRLQDHLEETRQLVTDHLIDWMDSRDALNGQTGAFQTLAYRAVCNGHSNQHLMTCIRAYGDRAADAEIDAWGAALKHLAEHAGNQ